MARLNTAAALLLSHNFCLSFFSCCCYKYWQKPLRKKKNKFISVHSSRYSPWQGSHITPIIRKQRDECMLACSLLSPFIQSRIPWSRNGSTKPKMGLPIAVNIAKITPQIDRAQLPGTSRFCPLTISPKYHSILNQVKSIRMHHGGLSWRNQILFS